MGQGGLASPHWGLSAAPEPREEVVWVSRGDTAHPLSPEELSLPVGGLSFGLGAPSHPASAH